VIDIELIAKKLVFIETDRQSLRVTGPPL